MKNTENFDILVTITGLNKYPGCRRLVEGESLTLVREPENQFDSFAVAVYGANGKIGYIANSSETVREGTMSAKGLCEFLETSAKATVVEGTYHDAVCRVDDVFDMDKIILCAFSHYGSGSYEEALELMLMLEEKYDSVFLKQYTADCLIKLGRYQNSFKYTEAVLRDEPENKISLMMYGDALEKTGDLTKAAEIYSKLLDISDNEEVRKALERCSEN